MTPHLRNHVRAYVDRALPPALMHLYDRHLVCCAMCRAAADQERRIVASLRADTGVPMSLRSSLIGLASAPPPEPPAPSGPRIPLPPIALRMPSAPSYEPVPTVSPGAPALHRSPMRAAVVASIAAGASVAAAWGLAVSPVSGSGSTSVRVIPAASFGQSSLTGLNGLTGHGLPVSRTSSSTGTTYGPIMPSRVTTGYWVVSGSATRGGDLGPVRIFNISSAQSGP